MQRSLNDKASVINALNASLWAFQEVASFTRLLISVQHEMFPD